MPDTWDCEAYGPEGRRAGALCFFASQLHVRLCETRRECHARMAAERQRVYGKIQESAADGDPVGMYLAGQFTNPEQLLGGSEVPDA